MNRQIRISPLRVIDHDGEQLGVLELKDALERASAQGLDLVEVAPTVRPPVARIMDYGKYKFELSKQARQARKKQHVVVVKEIKVRVTIDPHDLGIKMRHAAEFLTDSNKVRVTVQFKGREITHPEIGQRIMRQIIETLAETGAPEMMPRIEGKYLSALFIPKGKKTEPVARVRRVGDASGHSAREAQ